MRRLSLALLLALPACTLDFSHGVSSTPVPDAPIGHEVHASIVAVPIAGGAQSARLVDVDGDGAADLLYAAPDHIAIRKGDGHGAFAAETLGPSVAGVVQVAARPFDPSWPMGIVTATGSGELAAWERLPDASWDLVGSNRTTAPVTGVDIAYLGPGMDQEVKNSVVVTGADGYAILPVSPHRLGPARRSGGAGNGRASSLQVGRGRGTEYDLVAFISDVGGQLTANGLSGIQLGVVPYGSTPTSAAIIPDARPGEAQLVVGFSTPAAVSSVISGAATVTPTGALPPIDAVDTADLDGDGHADIIAGSLEPQHLTVIFSDLTIGPSYELAGSIAALHADGDANGDGITDPVVTYASGDVAILMSEAP